MSDCVNRHHKKISEQEYFLELSKDCCDYCSVCGCRADISKHGDVITIKCNGRHCNNSINFLGNEYLAMCQWNKKQRGFLE